MGRSCRALLGWAVGFCILDAVGSRCATVPWLDRCEGDAPSAPAADASAASASTPPGAPWSPRPAQGDGVFAASTAAAAGNAAANGTAQLATARLRPRRAASGMPVGKRRTALPESRAEGSPAVPTSGRSWRADATEGLLPPRQAIFQVEAAGEYVKLRSAVDGGLLTMLPAGGRPAWVLTTASSASAADALFKMERLGASAGGPRRWSARLFSRRAGAYINCLRDGAAIRGHAAASKGAKEVAATAGEATTLLDVTWLTDAAAKRAPALDEAAFAAPKPRADAARRPSKAGNDAGKERRHGADCAKSCSTTISPQGFLPVAWYAQNADFSHPKIVALPIGLNCFEHAPEMESARMKLRSEPLARTHLAWVRGNPHLVGFYSRIATHKYVVAPRGNGVDTHRLWEALYLGCVPIVLRSALDGLYERVGVLVVRSWKDVSAEMLERSWPRLQRILANNSHLLDRRHWQAEIERDRHRALFAARRPTDNRSRCWGPRD
ncbi:hypothetical protein M885DRAFT_501087 [Pelagophyceae sp. CCMP2097]|nr:hypothetical protein M885DRAFT_501087 [Pelagophyceae sp. CCMP2097]